MKSFLRILLILFAFIVSQLAATYAAIACSGADLTKATDTAALLATISPVLLGRVTLAVDLVFVAVVWLSGLAGRKVFAAPPMLTPGRTLLVAVSFIVAAQGLSFMMTPLQLDDLGTTAQFAEMQSDWLCIVALCGVIPLTEEMVFRAGILREMVAGGTHKWIAIVTTAVAFGVFHGNTFQALPAIAMGVCLGWLYMKTGSLRLCLLAHIANNSVACLEMHFSQYEARLEALPALNLVVIGICFLYLGVRYLYRALKDVEPEVVDEASAPDAVPSDFGAKESGSDAVRPE